MSQILDALSEAKASLAGVTSGTGVTAGTAATNDQGVFYRVINGGWQYLFEGWNRGDTFTAIGLTLTVVSVVIAWKSLKLRTEELKFKRNQSNGGDHYPSRREGGTANHAA